MKLNILESFPEELLHLDVKDVHSLLKGPTLFHLKGEKKEAVFLSTLLHANETTSFYMLQRLIKKYQNKQLPRDLIIFIGNTFAAREGLRHLPGQADFNRIWEEGDKPENMLAMDVVSYAKEFPLFASIDVHNNTGKNPHYACMNVLKESFLNLASHFGSHTVYFTEPHNVHSMAFSKICPAVTVEAGLPGAELGIQASLEYVDKILHMESLSLNPKRPETYVHHTIARMKVDHMARVDFDYNIESESDLSFLSDLDYRNFEEISEGTVLGYVKNPKLISVVDDFGHEITDEYFRFEDNKLICAKSFIPSMFTKDVYVMKEDCLGYIMETMEVSL